MDISTIIISAGTGSAVTGFFAVIASVVHRRANERRQIRDLAVKVALENRKIFKEAFPERVDIPPLDVYLVHAMYLVGGLDGRLTTEAAVQEHLKRCFSLSLAAQKQIHANRKP